MPSTDFGFNVIGHVSGNLGLGVSARNIVQVLLNNDFPVALLDIDPGLKRQNYDRRFEALTVQSVEELPFAVNLLVLPPSTLVKFIPQYLGLLNAPGHFNAALTWWELPLIPPHWRRALEFFDVLVAPSEFIRHTLDRELTRALTISARHPIYLPENVNSRRDRFGIEGDRLVFVTSFEMASDPTRKNVLAVVDAFNIGLANVPEARLLIKLHNAQNVPTSNRLIRALRKACEVNSRIRIIDEPLSYAEVLSLYASSDVFVSLHRAEGLGLRPMEALALGKVAIATAWSGNMTYNGSHERMSSPVQIGAGHRGTRCLLEQRIGGADTSLGGRRRRGSSRVDAATSRRSAAASQNWRKCGECHCSLPGRGRREQFRV